jgi:catalase
MSKDKKTLTGNFGSPVDDDQNSLTAGNPGPPRLRPKILH